MENTEKVLPLDGEGGPRRSLGSDRVRRASVPALTSHHPLRLAATRPATSPCLGEDLTRPGADRAINPLPAKGPQGMSGVKGETA